MGSCGVFRMGAGVLVSRLVAAALALPAGVAGVLASGAPAVASDGTLTSFSYTSQSGDYIGQGGSGTLTAPTTFRLSGTAGSLRFTADAGSEYWDVTLAAPKGQQLSTGVYQSALRAPFNDTAPGLSVTSTGRGCNTVKGWFTVYAISADTSGQVTSLDADFTQFCDGSAAALTGTMKYGAPASAPVVLSSSAPSSVDGQAVTLTARVLPGTGPVTFYDGNTVLGQANPDSAALTRLTTSNLAPGSHQLTARQGTATSAGLTQTVADGSTSLLLASTAGDYIGQGASASYVPPAATITASASPSSVTVHVGTGDVSAYWDVTLAAPTGQSLTVGSYTGAERAPFRSAGHPGLEVTGSGRGCNNLTGSFTVDQLVMATDGTLSRLDASFTQYCDGSTAPLRGRVRFATSAPVPVASTTTLTSAVGSGGQVTLTATVSGASGPAAGTVTFTDGATALGTSTVDAAGRAVLDTTLAVGSHAVTASYGGSATYSPSTATAQVVVPAPSTTSLGVDKTVVKAGKTVLFTVTVNGGTTATTGTATLYDGAQAVRTVSLSGGAAQVVWVAVTKGTHSFTARYGGDATHTPSTSAPVSVRVS